jgi:CO/xanthine dehydrogenase Mo-binding subunit
MSVVGTNAPRKEGPQKLCGQARYVDDVALPGCLQGVTFRSPIAAGRIEAIEFDAAFPWDECVVATAADIPGRNVVTLIETDQPLLVERDIRHHAEPILLLAHEKRDMAWAALDHVVLRTRPSTPVLSMDDALRAETLVHAPDNCLKTLHIEKGDVESALRRADFVVEGTYEVPAQEQAYIENNGVAAWFDEDGVLTVLGSMQCPYYIQKALMPLFALPADKVRVQQATTGGGFGGKEEYPNMIAGHAALLAHKSGRPVKMIYDRHEDMIATTKRHPARVRHRTGVTKDGVLLAQDIDIVMDGGAYVTLSPVVLSRGILHASGPYACPDVRIHARSVATNTPPSGAFRGFGAPQTLFAAELHWERIAQATGIDALTLRRRNLVRQGSELPTGQVLHDSVGASDVLEDCVRRTSYEKKRREYDRWNRKRANPTWKGIGLAVVHHGAGFTGSGEVMLQSQADVALTRDGRIIVDASSTEIGQGTNSMFASIVADALGVPYDWIDIETPDTAKVPDSGPTVASRTCMIVGALLVRASNHLRRAVQEVAGGTKLPVSRQALRRAAAALCDDDRAGRGGAHVGARSRDGDRIVFSARYEKPPEVQWDDTTYRGDAYPVYGYAAVVVDLQVDKLTCEVKIDKLTTAHDVGHAIHPLLVEGQVMGGVTQALGWALLENTVYDDGKLLNAQFTNYIIPTALDTPPLDVHLIGKPYARGPFGAKGVGEIPMDVPAPAVAAAVHQAIGKLVDRLPILPESIAMALTTGEGT